MRLTDSPWTSDARIDVAGGTGDMALRILDHVQEQYTDKKTIVQVVDINGQMLKEGYKKTMYHKSQLLQAHHGRPSYRCTSSSFPLLSAAWSCSSSELVSERSGCRRI
ncbi:hypothetical protein C8R43DRAFT_1042816 [Mycena crocata]|nr:hypothetical protein C8R43DRAFT_1042816 [Mycena crocata]